MLKTECFYNAGELTVDELMKQIDDYMETFAKKPFFRQPKPKHRFSAIFPPNTF
ncbi:hypothetical protein [Neisseria sicca]|uniref:hypothetical protein n=1 Tax=Neisseria sicca TaxID=490 RepID=UPI0039893A1F